MNVLLYEDSSEPITKIALKYSNQLNLVCIDIKELLNNGVVFDKISFHETIINWYLSNGTHITNDNTNLLINRIFKLPTSMFFDFEEEDKSYAHAEFLSYLMFAINSFVNVAEKPANYFLLAPVFPLPQQWEKIKKLLPNWKTPSYFLGSSPPNSFLRKNLVSSQVYNFYFWKALDHKSMTRSLFLFEKPRGCPYLVLSRGVYSTIYPLDGARLEDLSDEMKESIKKSCIKIKDNFGYLISETLVFINKSSITFGMTTNCPIQGQFMEGFEGLILEFLQNYINEFEISAAFN